MRNAAQFIRGWQSSFNPLDLFQPRMNHGAARTGGDAFESQQITHQDVPAILERGRGGSLPRAFPFFGCKFNCRCLWLARTDGRFEFSAMPPAPVPVLVDDCVRPNGRTISKRCAEQ